MAVYTKPWLLLLLVLVALNFARIASESLILDPQSFEDDEFDLMEELDFDQEDFWTSDDSISNISPDYQVERERYSNAAERLETENRELERAHATMESACFVVTALLPLAAFCMMKLYSDRLSPVRRTYFIDLCKGWSRYDVENANLMAKYLAHSLLLDFACSSFSAISGFTKESRTDDRARELRSKDEKIRQMEKIIHDKSKSIDSLHSEIESLRAWLKFH